MGIKEIREMKCSRNQFLLILGAGIVGVMNLKNVLAFNFTDKFLKEKDIETEILNLGNCLKMNAKINKDLSFTFNKGEKVSWFRVAEKESNYVGIKLTTQSILSKWKVTVNGKSKIFIGKDIKFSMKLKQMDRIKIQVEKLSKGKIKVKDVILYYGN